MTFLIIGVTVIISLILIFLLISVANTSETDLSRGPLVLITMLLTMLLYTTVTSGYKADQFEKAHRQWEEDRLMMTEALQHEMLMRQDYLWDKLNTEVNPQ